MWGSMATHRPMRDGPYVLCCTMESACEQRLMKLGLNGHIKSKGTFVERHASSLKRLQIRLHVSHIT